MKVSECNDAGRSSTSKNGTESALLKLAEMEEKAEAQRTEAVRITAEIQDAISRLCNDDLESVLINRYLNFLTIEQTAERMNYSPETIKRKQRYAIEKLTPFDLV